MIGFPLNWKKGRLITVLDICEDHTVDDHSKSGKMILHKLVQDKSLEVLCCYGDFYNCSLSGMEQLMYLSLRIYGLQG